jgi:glucokinase
VTKTTHPTSTYPAPDAPALCVDLGGTEIKAALARGPELIRLASRAVSSDADSLTQIADVVGQLLAEESVDHVSHVAIAVPGVVDARRTALTAAFGKYDDLLGVDLVAWARAEFHADGTVEHDGRAALVGEQTFGVATAEPNAVLVTLGTGIGTAVAVDGIVLTGPHGHAGILGGHATVCIDGPGCTCGNVGCAEAVASTWALDRELRAHPGMGTDTASAGAWRDRLESGESIGVGDLIAAVDAPTPEPIASDLLERFLRVWGAVVVTMCHEFDPDVVILTGGVLRAGERIAGPVRSYVGRHLWPSMPRPRIVVPTHPDRSVLLGLAAIADRSVDRSPVSVASHTREGAAR